jgi:serine protease Do
MKKLSVLLISVLLILSLVLGTGCSLIAGGVAEEKIPTVEDTGNTGPVEEIVIPDSPQLEALPSIADVVAAVKPSVVAINTEITITDFFSRESTQEAAGSGWIISEDGYIVTNNHVVADAQSITVVLEDGRIYDAEVVGTDPLTDIAVIKIKAENLPAAKVGDSSNMRIGDWVVAIGNSLGLGIRATQGIVSRTDVSLQVDINQLLYGLIETDAAINPGNSGGPLVNLAGQVIGINSVKQVQVEVEGVGYAISTEEAVPIIEQLINDGEASHPYLGVSFHPVDQLVISNFGLTIDHGVFIVDVGADSPADRAGLRSQDVILSFNGREIETEDDLIIGIRSAEIGQEVEIVYWRNDKENTTTATLIKRPAST